MANPILPRRSRDLVLYPTGPVPVELGECVVGKVVAKPQIKSTGTGPAGIVQHRRKTNHCVC